MAPCFQCRAYSMYSLKMFDFKRHFCQKQLTEVFSERWLSLLVSFILKATVYNRKNGWIALCDRENRYTSSPLSMIVKKDDFLYACFLNWLFSLFGLNKSKRCVGLFITVFLETAPMKRVSLKWGKEWKWISYFLQRESDDNDVRREEVRDPTGEFPRWWHLNSLCLQTRKRIEWHNTIQPHPFHYVIPRKLEVN